MAATQQEIETIGKRWWPDYDIIVGPNLIDPTERPATEYSFFVCSDSDHMVVPAKGETWEHLKENVLKRVIETLVRRKWAEAQCTIRRGGGFARGPEIESSNFNGWIATIHLGGKWHPIKASALDGLVEKVHRSLTEWSENNG
jgi:hypothetical protein